MANADSASEEVFLALYDEDQFEVAEYEGLEQLARSLAIGLALAMLVFAFSFAYAGLVLKSVTPSLGSFFLIALAVAIAHE